MALGNNDEVSPARTHRMSSSASSEPLAMPPAAIARLDALARRETPDTAGGTVTWRCFGQGPALVLLHGGHGSWLHWLRNIEALSATRTVCVPDMPGYGDSASPAEATLASLLDSLQASLDTLIGGRTPIGLAGFSFGGLVASHLALRRGHVERLALLGTAGHGSPRRQRSELKNWRPAQARGDAAALRSVMHHNLLGLMLNDEAHLDETAMHIHTVSCLRTRFHSRTLSQSADLRLALEPLKQPVLLLWGEHDVTATPQALVGPLTDGRPQRRLEIVPDVGHWVGYEAHERVNARLRTFFDPATAPWETAP